MVPYRECQALLYSPGVMPVAVRNARWKPDSLSNPHANPTDATGRPGSCSSMTWACSIRIRRNRAATPSSPNMRYKVRRDAWHAFATVAASRCGSARLRRRKSRTRSRASASAASGPGSTRPANEAAADEQPDGVREQHPGLLPALLGRTEQRRKERRDHSARCALAERARRQLPGVTQHQVAFGDLDHELVERVVEMQRVRPGAVVESEVAGRQRGGSPVLLDPSDSPLLDAGQQVFLVSLSDERAGTPNVLASRHHGRQLQVPDGNVLDPAAEPAGGQRLRGKTHEGGAYHLAPVGERLASRHRRGGQLRVGPPVQGRRHTCSITRLLSRCLDRPRSTITALTAIFGGGDPRRARQAIQMPYRYARDPWCGTLRQCVACTGRSCVGHGL